MCYFTDFPFLGCFRELVAHHSEPDSIHRMTVYRQQFMDLVLGSWQVPWMFLNTLDTALAVHDCAGVAGSVLAMPQASSISRTYICVLFSPALGRGTQLDPCSLMTSQLSLLGEVV